MKTLLCFLHLFACLIFQVNGQSPKQHYRELYSDILITLNFDTSKTILEVEEELAPMAAMDSIWGKNRIRFKQRDFETFPDVVFIGAICHELGHITLKHYGPTSKSKEIAADILCGYYMRQLSFQRVEDTYEFVKQLDGNDEYLPRSERKKLIKQGWDSAYPVSVVTSYVAFNPTIYWQTKGDTLMVNIGGWIIKDPERRKYDFGIFYDPKTLCTYQLDDFPAHGDANGTGRLITNRTTLVYQLRKRYGFVVYSKGEIVTDVVCDPADADGFFVNPDNDLEITCRNEKHEPVTYLLKDYGIVQEYFLFPIYIK